MSNFAKLLPNAPAASNGKPKMKYLLQASTETAESIKKHFGLESYSDVMCGQAILAAAYYWNSLPEEIQRKSIEDFEGTVPTVAKR
jgi:hypothetical protein